ncbi:MAG: PH domain-containing protein [Clostridia bacterium]|nr:PH domain-containing protein [Clostridia bacterium]
MEKLSKRALGCMYTASIIGAVILLGIIAALNIFVFFPYGVTVGKIISLVIAIIVVANAAISPIFRYHRYSYSITDEFIDLREGYIFVERNIVPIERLHKMETQRGPIDRMFKVAKVIVTTAGGDVVLRFLDEEKADFIAENLGRRVNRIAAEQRESNEN